MKYGYFKDKEGKDIYIDDTHVLHNGKRLVDVIYPIGSVYISVNSTNPSNLFGGTWEQIKGRFLLGAGRVEANTNNFWGELSAGDVDSPVGELGGEAMHVLTQDEIPNYSVGKIPAVVPFNHVGWGNGGVHGSDLGQTSPYKHGITANNNDITSGVQYGWEISTNGGGYKHNNMPPYFVVYMWKRIS